MTVVFDAEALLAFGFDERGATTVEQWLDRVYDGDCDGYVATITLAEVRYVAIRKTSQPLADSHIADLLDMGLTAYSIDGLWRDAAALKAKFHPALADAYALATAIDLDADTESAVTLLVGADDDYDVFEDHDQYSHFIERFRDKQR